MLLFNESRWMGLTAYTTALITVIVLPVLLFTGADSSMALLVRSAATVIIVLCTIAFQLGYKFVMIFTMSDAEIINLTKQTSVNTPNTAASQVKGSAQLKLSTAGTQPPSKI